MSSVEFYVRNVMRAPTGETLVIGVPNNGQPLSVGDQFVTEYEVDRGDVMSGAPNPARLNSVAVDLVVQKIDVMRTEVQQLPHGVTAALSLVGSGLDQVKVGGFLRTKEK